MTIKLRSTGQPSAGVPHVIHVLESSAVSSTCPLMPFVATINDKWQTNFDRWYGSLAESAPWDGR
jgi:hypothetical protein